MDEDKEDSPDEDEDSECLFCVLLARMAGVAKALLVSVGLSKGFLVGAGPDHFASKQSKRKGSSAPPITSLDWQVIPQESL